MERRLYVSSISSLWKEKHYGLTISAVLLLVIMLVWMRFHNFLLFHTTAELFSILVGFGIAAIALHTVKISPEAHTNLPTFLCVA
jgi:hypothetical protein